MNFQAAAIVAAVAFVLSLLAGLLGGVALFDIVLRALFWGAVGFGGCLGVEFLVRTFLPELLEPGEPGPAGVEDSGPRVNIVVEEDVPRSFESGDLGPQRPTRTEAPPESMGGEPEGDEMPEIGSFLDSFRPGAGDPEGPEPSESSAGAGSSVLDSAPDFSSSPGEVTIDGEHQDPALMARAVQTVMKRDGQGN